MILAETYDIQKRENHWRKYWQKNKIYQFQPKSEKSVFSVDTPPPYVSAEHLHVGHIMSYAQAEFIVRFKRMQGFNVFYPMGFDDNGLPTERFVEKKYKLDKSIYVVGSEQDYHFKCLFEILSQLSFDFAEKCYHLSYGMVYLPEGKMKSREGKVVDGDGLIAEMEEMAKEEIKKRDLKNKLSLKELNERACKIALGAIKFYLLIANAPTDLHFDPKQSLSFEGKTGPYCLYSYARAKSVLRKANIKTKATIQAKQTNFSLLKEREALALARGLLEIKIALKDAQAELNPSKLTQAVYNLALLFNQFYQALPVINKKNPNLTQARLKLVEAVSVALKQGLNLLGLETLDEM